MKRKVLIVLCCLLFLEIVSMVRNWSLTLAEDASGLYFDGGEVQLRKEINHGLDLVEEKSRVIEIRPLLHENGYVYCFYLTDNGRFGDVYYPENDSWVKWITLSEDKEIGNILQEMGKAIVFSEYKNIVNFDDQFSPIFTHKTVIDHDTITEFSVTLGEASGNPKIIYVALADGEYIK